MEGKRFINRMKVQNLLSFDEEGVDIELQPLNVLIGQNGSGKSNFIDIVSILQATQIDITAPFTKGGGIAEWLCKSAEAQNAAIEIVVEPARQRSTGGIRYRLQFTVVNQRFRMVDEIVENEYPSGKEYSSPFSFYRFRSGSPELYYRNTNMESDTPTGWTKKYLADEDFNPNQSIFQQRKDPLHYPDLTHVGERFSSILLYRNWDIGRLSTARVPQPADLPNDFLSENTRNLGAVLDSLLRHTTFHESIIGQLQELYARISDVRTLTSGGTVQVFVRENELRELIPATRLSDGTVRFLCLLVILCHPAPPPLICIEEPELGLHPDVIHKIAELLKDAATRTQLIVTTHSDLLVSALSDIPEAIVVCEHDGKGTRMKRLEREPLEAWLKDYSLGEVWLKGEIGGTRY
jgi:predicted ATPase